MTTVARTVLLSTAICLAASLTFAQNSSKIVVSNQEPARVPLAGLFEQSDTVALIKVVSGDTENYNSAVYKAAVIQSFKGPAQEGAIYFGPYIGMRLGWEYIVFLRNVREPIAPKTTSSSNYGTVRYAEVFNEGYTAMMTSYECVFEGKEPVEQCDYGVRVCTDYIVLPNSMPTFPVRTENSPFGCRWVRKTSFISLLRSLARSHK